ncbi:exosome complex component rrp41-like [Plakobranchus ocellatus]|uniref:Putative exosome complex component RRP41 n=1 Tax=Plakobranchus ocellatus TaxID=259542 RepID=A0AAV4BMW4_9GAST|nr:exosome complex component rrp41-like [Plakobranchus ocellatus]
MAGMELLSDQGFRIDGRKPNELRRIRFKKGVFRQADGSAYLEQGNTKVLAAVYGPHEIRGSRSKALHDKLLINCQYSMATFSTQDRKRRPRGDRKAQEMTSHLKQTFDAVVLTELYPKVQLDIFVEVLQSDGGNYCASVNAATLALMDAGIPMKDYVIACSGSHLRDTPIVDMNNLEESSGGAEVVMAVLPRCEQIVFLEMNSRLHEDHLSGVMDHVMVGCKDIFNVLNQQVQDELCQKTQLDKLVTTG